MIKEGEGKLFAQQMLIMVAHVKDARYMIQNKGYRIQNTDHMI